MPFLGEIWLSRLELADIRHELENGHRCLDEGEMCLREPKSRPYYVWNLRIERQWGLETPFAETVANQCRTGLSRVNGLAAQKWHF
jgi:hypothetical protein